MVDYGWCSRRRGDNYAPDEHDGGFEHDRSPSCANFVSDREHTERLIVEARVTDARTTLRYPSGATTAEGNYVREVVPEASNEQVRGER